MIRVLLPFHLRNLAKVNGECTVDVVGIPSAETIVNALEAKYPTLKGTIRDHVTRKRRPLVRYFVCGEDWSFESTDRRLPAEIVDGKEAFWIVGAVAGG
jgi:sulfur-carrier protein